MCESSAHLGETVFAFYSLFNYSVKQGGVVWICFSLN
jgi:hypothetical protein